MMKSTFKVVNAWDGVKKNAINISQQKKSYLMGSLVASAGVSIFITVVGVSLLLIKYLNSLV